MTLMPSLGSLFLHQALGNKSIYSVMAPSVIYCPRLRESLRSCSGLEAAQTAIVFEYPRAFVTLCPFFAEELAAIHEHDAVSTLLRAAVEIERRYSQLVHQEEGPKDV